MEDATETMRVGADLASTAEEGQEDLLQAETLLIRMRSQQRQPNRENFTQKVQCFSKPSGNHELVFGVRSPEMGQRCLEPTQQGGERWAMMSGDLSQRRKFRLYSKNGRDSLESRCLF